MYTVSENYLNQIKRQVQSFRITGTINDTSFTHHDILSGSFTITNQCSEQNDVKIGSVYIGELKCTFKPNMVDDWDNAVITVSEGLLIGNTYEDVPLGVFYVKEAEDTDYGASITAYDGMCKFNKKCSPDTTIGTPYELLSMACRACKVTLGMTAEEVAALPNGTRTLSLYTENDIETWQDFLYWIAQTLGSFATINRQGQLVLRKYGTEPVDTLTNHDRFRDSKFSKFTTRYSGISVVNIKKTTTNYYGKKPDNYLTYNLGANPFMQYGTKEYKESAAREILDVLAEIRYVPFQTGVLCGALYDLGDVIRCTNGIAKGKNGCVMQYEYTFNGGYKLAGYGADPELASAKSKTDKNLAGISSSLQADITRTIEFVNAKSFEIGGTPTEVIRMRVVTSKETKLQFLAEILCTASDDVVCEVTYRKNNTEQAFAPVETWQQGRHILNLIFLIDTEDYGVIDWQVFLKATGGTLSIDAENIRAYITGQGMTESVEWDGTITIEETIAQVSIVGDIEVQPFVTNAIVDVINPAQRALQETIGLISLDNINVTKMSDILLIDKSGISHKTWESIRTYTWNDMAAGFIWG